MKDKQTFMQMFRQWTRSGSSRRATACPNTVNEYGYSMAVLFDQYETRTQQARTTFSINTVVNHNQTIKTESAPASRLLILRRSWLSQRQFGK